MKKPSDELLSLCLSERATDSRTVFSAEWWLEWVSVSNTEPSDLEWWSRDLSCPPEEL